MIRRHVIPEQGDEEKDDNDENEEEEEAIGAIEGSSCSFLSHKR